MSQRAPRRNNQGRTRNRGVSGKQRQYSAQAPSQRKRTTDAARRTAYEVLRAVSADDAYANLVLPQRIRHHRLDERDAAFATELTYGTLRSQGTYDAILARCVDRELSQLDAEVLDTLRLGAHQLLNMRVPPHAALDSTVGLVRELIGAGPAGLVNAVLRKVSAHQLSEWLSHLVPDDNSVDALSVRHAHPPWIVRALRQALVTHGRSSDELPELLAANNAAPLLNLVALPGIGDLQPVLDHGAEKGPLAPDSALFRGGDAGKIPGVSTGTVRVQDVGSQLCARALTMAPAASTRTAEAPEAWLDLCAGPGGKAALLASLASNGTELLANEPSAHRAELVRQSLKPIPATVWSIRQEDGRTIGSSHTEHFQRILVDAPCTGLGALRRRPESRWRRQPSDLAPLTQLQAELLDAAVMALAPGGVLGFVTCSPHPAETRIQVDDLLRRHPKLQLLDTAGALAAASIHHPQSGPALDRNTVIHPDADPNANTAQLWPHIHATDAMFMALLRKPAA